MRRLHCSPFSGSRRVSCREFSFLGNGSGGCAEVTPCGVRSLRVVPRYTFTMLPPRRGKSFHPGREQRSCQWRDGFLLGFLGGETVSGVAFLSFPSSSTCLFCRSASRGSGRGRLTTSRRDDGRLYPQSIFVVASRPTDPSCFASTYPARDGIGSCLRVWGARASRSCRPRTASCRVQQSTRRGLRECRCRRFFRA